jgi:PadR family transcriptional regulator, regulatory protein PadR
LRGPGNRKSSPIDATGRTITRRQSDLLQGTQQILVLKALLAGPTHGYGIARWIEHTTDDVLRIDEGSLSPALRRLEDEGFITSDWGLSDNNRRARVYSLTTAAERAFARKQQRGALRQRCRRALRLANLLSRSSSTLARRAMQVTPRSWTLNSPRSQNERFKPTAPPVLCAFAAGAAVRGARAGHPGVARDDDRSPSRIPQRRHRLRDGPAARLTGVLTWCLPLTQKARRGSRRAFVSGNYSTA